MWNIYTIEFNIKKKEILISVTTWMNLEIITLSEVSRSEKDNMVSLVCGI